MFAALFAQLDTVEKQSGGESVSQPPLKDQAFSTILDQNPRFELRPEMGIPARAKA